MNTKNFIVGALVAGIVNFFLGWVFYAMLFESIFPSGESMDLTFIFLGCMTYGFFLSYVLNKWAHPATVNAGMMGGAMLGFLTTLYTDFFRLSRKTDIDWMPWILDMGIMLVISAVMGACIVFVAKKMK